MRAAFALLGLLLAVSLPAPAASIAPTARVEYTIRDAGPPWPGLTVPYGPAYPWLGWAGKPIQASWDAGTARLTLYLPDGAGVSRCPVRTCVAAPVAYRLIAGWQAEAVLAWPPPVPWYLGYAGDALPYTVAGDRLIVQLGPQAAGSSL